MNSRIKVSAFSSAEENMQALLKWRKINEEHMNKVKAFCDQNTALKKKSKENADKSLWIADRDLLAKDQETCEAELAEIVKQIKGLHEDDVSNTRTKWDFQENILQQVQSVQNEFHLLKKVGPLEHSVESLKSKIITLKKYIEFEMQKSESDIEANSIDKISKMDVSDLLLQTKLSIAILHERFPESKKIHEAFSEALEYEQRSLTGHLAEVEATPPLLSSSKAINSVTLLLNLAQRGRHADTTLSLQKHLRDRVSMSFPELSKAEVDVLVEEALELKKNQQLVRAFVLDYKRATERLLIAYETALDVERGQREFEIRVKDEKSIRLKQLEGKHQQLAQQRNEYKEKVRENEMIKRKLRALEDHENSLVKLKRMEEFRKRLHQLIEYERIKTETLRKESELQTLRLKQKEMERTERMELNGKRVAFRQQKYVDRIKLKQDLEKELSDLNQKKRMALENFFLSVERQIGVQSNPERLVRATESSAQAHIYTPFAEATRSKISGYTDDEIMRDPRVKLYHALLEAGLHKTPYGREVVSRNFRIPLAQRANDANPFHRNLPEFE